MQTDPLIDAVILACTHYPLLLPKIRKYLPSHVRIIQQGHYVAQSLASYLQRHPDIAACCSTNARTRYLSTERPDRFAEQAQIFLRQPVEAEHVELV